MRSVIAASSSLPSLFKYASVILNDESIVSTQEKLLSDQKYEAIFDFLFEKVGTVLLDRADNAAENFFFVLFQLLDNFDQSENNKFQKSIDTILSKEDNAPLRLSIATKLLHLLETAKPKYATILYSIIKYTQRSKFYDSIQKLYIDHADELLEEMKADATQKRKFYALFAEVLHESKSFNSYYEMVQKYLHSFKKEDKDFTSETTTQFLKTHFLNLLNEPSLYLYNNLLIPFVLNEWKAQDASLTPVVELLQILVSKSVEDYITFAQSNKSWMESNGLSNENLLFKSRVLNLCTLFQQNTEIPFDQVASQLKLESSLDIQRLIIKAVATGLIKGKMDQVKQVVYPEKTTLRQFTAESWTQLNDQIAAWKYAIGNIISQATGSVGDETAATSSGSATAPADAADGAKRKK